MHIIAINEKRELKFEKEQKRRYRGVLSNKREGENYLIF